MSEIVTSLSNASLGMKIYCASRRTEDGERPLQCSTSTYSLKSLTRTNRAPTHPEKALGRSSGFIWLRELESSGAVHRVGPKLCPRKQVTCNTNHDYQQSHHHRRRRRHRRRQHRQREDARNQRSSLA